MVDVFYGMHWMLATPFLENEQVDYESIPNIVKKAKEVNCAGLVGLGAVS